MRWGEFRLKAKTLNWVALTPLATKDIDGLLNLEPPSAIARTTPYPLWVVEVLEDTYLPNTVPKNRTAMLQYLMVNTGFRFATNGKFVVWKENEWMLDEWRDWAEPDIVRDVHSVRKLIYSSQGVRRGYLEAVADQWGVSDIDLIIDILREYHHLRVVNTRRGGYVLLPFERERMDTLRRVVIGRLKDPRCCRSKVERSFLLGVNRPYEKVQMRLRQFLWG